MPMNHIVYATDANYWMHLYVSLYSLLFNNKNQKFSVYVITDSKNQDFFSKLPALYKLGNLENFKCIEINKHTLDWLPLMEHFTVATYYRLLIGRLLDQKIKKVLYIDCDTVVEDSLNEIFETNIDDFLLAAVVDQYYTDHSSRLGLRHKIKWFNGGILLINLDKWREMKAEDRMFDFIKQNEEMITCADEDALNAISVGNWLELNPRFNIQKPFARSIKEGMLSLKPAIIHFIESKPWEYMSEHPYKERYWFYLKKTPYSSYKEPDRNLVNILIKITRKAPMLHSFLRGIKKVLLKTD